MNGSLSLIDLVVLALYLAGMIAMGVWFSRRSGTPDQFMKAGGGIPGWAVGISISGTYDDFWHIAFRPQTDTISA